MKIFLSICMLIIFSSCSFLRKHKTSSSATVDSTATRSQVFVEFKNVDSAAKTTSIDTGTKRTWWVEETTTNTTETIDTTGRVITKVTTTTTKKAANQVEKTGRAATSDVQVTKTGITTAAATETKTHHQETKTTDKKTQRMQTSIWFLIYQTALVLAFLIWWNWDGLLLTLFGIKRRKRQPPSPKHPHFDDRVA